MDTVQMPVQTKNDTQKKLLALICLLCMPQRERITNLNSFYDHHDGYMDGQTILGGGQVLAYGPSVNTPDIQSWIVSVIYSNSIYV